MVLCVFLCKGRSSIARDAAEPGSVHLHRILVFANKFSAGLVLTFLGQTVAIESLAKYGLLLINQTSANLLYAGLLRVLVIQSIEEGSPRVVATV